MYEVELKVPADHPPVRERLSEMGAEPTGGVVQVDTYYDAPDRSFADTDEALRFRQEQSVGTDHPTGTGTGEPGDSDGIGPDGDGTADGEPDRDAEGTGGPDGPPDRDDDWDRTAITYKGPKVDDSTQTREEHETGVTDPDAATGLLEGLGYEAVASVRKERHRYATRGATVTLDAVDGLGTFVEVEIETDREQEVPEARSRATAVLEELGLDPAAGIRESYLELVLSER